MEMTDSQKIIDFMRVKIKEMTTTEFIVYIYSNAIADALDFIDEMAKHNPQHRLAYLQLVQAMKPLRLDGEE